MAGLYPIPGDTHTGKNLEYIKDMISGISLQIAGVAISNMSLSGHDLKWCEQISKGSL
jgi:hypothetical protein